MLELAKRQYIDDRENVLLIGSSGVDKTHLAIAMGLAASGSTWAALDRLTHHGHILEAKGESFRLWDARRRQRRSSGPCRSRNRAHVAV